MSLNSGAVATYTVSGTVSQSATGSLANTATAGVPAGWTDPVAGNNSATDTDTLVPTSDLAVTKTDGSATEVPGTTVSYTVTVTNLGPSAVTGATFTDTVPATITGVTWTCSITSGSGSCAAASGSGNAIATSVSLNSGAVATYTVSGTVSQSATGSLANTATAGVPAGWTDPVAGNNSATDTDTLVPTSDLAVTKTDGSATEVPGTTVSYTVTVTNLGPSAVTGATFTDTVPATITGVTWTCSITSGSGSCAAASGSGNAITTSLTLTSGSAATFTVSGTVAPSATGTLANTASAAVPAGVTDPVAGNNSATDTNTLTPQSDLTVTKTDGQTTAAPGQALTYTVTVTNNGPSNVAGALLTDDVPAAVAGVSWSCSLAGAGACATASGTGSAVSTGLDLAVGSVATVTISGTVDQGAAGTLTNTAQVALPAGTTDPSLSNNSATDVDTLDARADLAVTKTDGSATAVPGQGIAYTVTVTNNGPSNVAAAGFADPVPAAVTGVSWSCSISTGTGACGAASGSGNAVSTSLALDAGAVATLTVSGTVAPGATGTLANTASASVPAGWTDPVAGNDSATDTDTLTPIADLGVTKTDGSVTAVPGAPLTYTIAVTNAGPSAVTGASISDTVPAALTGVSWTCAITSGTGSCGSSGGSGNSIATTVALGPAAVATLTVSGVVAAGVSGTLSNTAAVTLPAGVADPVPADNTATDVDTLTPQSDLAVTKTDGSSTAVPGSPVSWVVAVTNNGPSSVTGASVTDTIPAAVTGVTWSCSVTSGSGSCGSGSGSGNSIATTVSLAPGAVATLIVGGTLSSSAAGSLVNTAAASVPAGWTDPVAANDSATDTDTITPLADLAVSKTDGQASAVPGTAITYTVDVTNHGPSAVSGAALTDTVPAAITGVSWSCSITSGVGSCASPLGTGNAVSTTLDLAPGASAAVTISGVVSPAASGTLANTATITPPAGVTDPVLVNNSDTDSDALAPTTDLAVTKTDGTGSEIPGTNVTYTVTVSNLGPSDVSGATVSDVLPGTISAASWTCAVPPALGACGASSGSGNVATTLDLKAGASATLVVTGTISPAATGTLVNTASAAVPGGWTDPVSANDSATDIDTLAPRADLAVTKTDGSATAVPGSAVAWTVQVRNFGPSNVTGASFGDTVPASVTGVSWSCAITTGSGACGAAGGAGNAVSTTLDLASGAVATLTIGGTVAPGASGTLSNTGTASVPAGVSDPASANNSATDTDALTPRSDLVVTKSSFPDPYVAGAGLTYTVTVRNDGPSTVIGATVVDNVPAQVGAVTWSCAITSGTGACGTAGGSGNAIGTTLDLWPGATATLTIDGTVAPGTVGTVANTASAAVPPGWVDPDPLDNSATDTNPVTPAGDLRISKTSSPRPYVPGTPITYVISVTNGGPSDVVGADVTDGLPAELTGATWSCAVAPADGNCGTPVGSGDVSTNLDLRAGTTATITVTADVDPSAVVSITNAASVTAPVGFVETNPANNSATDFAEAHPVSDLQVAKSDGQSSAVPGDPVSYTATVTNAGPSYVYGASFDDSVPAAVTGVSWTCSVTTGTGACSMASGSGNTIALSLDLAPGAVATVIAGGTVSPSATGSLSNTASADVPGGWADPVPGDNSATDVDTLTPRADLLVTKTDGQATAIPGQQIDYTVTVTNDGPSYVAGASVSDAVPAAITGVGWTCVVAGGGSCGAASGSGNGVTTTVDLGPGATATIEITGTVSPSASGSISNTVTATVPAGVVDPVPGNNAATDVDTLAPQSDLAVTKTDGRASAVPGQALAYTVTVTNGGPSAVTGATVSDVVPAAVTGVSWTCSVTTGTGACGAVSGSGNAVATTLDLASGAVATLVVSGAVSPSASGSLSNTASVSVPSGWTDPVSANDSATDTDTLTPRADLVVTKTDGQAGAVPGSAVTYTVTVTNGGPSAVTGATVSDSVPAAVTGVSWTCVVAGGGSCGAASGSGNAVATTLDLASGAVATLVVSGTVSPSASGSLSNTASASVPAGWTDPVPGNNSATDVDALAPQSDLAVTKSDGVAALVPGGPVTYTVAVTNNGPSSVSGAGFADSVPAAVTGVSWTCVVAGGGSCGAASGSGNAVATTLDLASGAVATFTVSGTVSASATGSLANTATASVPSGWTDPVPGNDSATDTDTLTGAADLSVTKTDGVGALVPGSPVTYTVVVTNNGPSAVTGATLADAVPAAVTAVSWSCAAAGGGSCGAASGSGNAVSTDVDLPSGTTATVTIDGIVSPVATGTLSNTATIAVPAGVTDPVAANDTATDVDVLVPQADLEVAKTDGQSSTAPGQPVTYTVAVTNNGPSAVTGAPLTDVVPASVTGVSWTCAVAGSGSCATPSGSGNAVSEALDLAPGAVATVVVSGTVAPGATGVLVNTASIAAPAGVTDTVPGNNSDTDTDTLTPLADLAVSNGSSPSPYVAGAPISYSVSVTNNGPSAVTGASFTDAIPAGVTAVSWACVVSTGTGSCGSAAGTGNAIAAGLDLASGAVATFTVSGVVAAGTTGVLTSTASVAAPAGVTDPVPGNNTAIDTNAPAVNADLAVSNSSLPFPYVAGGPLVYTAQVTNNGPSAVAGASFTDAIPAGVTTVTWTCLVAGGGSCGASAGSGNAIAAGLDLASGAVATFTVSGVVAAGTTGVLTSTASVAAPAGVTDPVPGNNTAIDTNQASSVADLAVSNSSSPVPYVDGGAITYTVQVTNNGPAGVTGATLTDAIPAGVTAVSWACVVSTGTGSCGSAAGTGNAIAAGLDLASGAVATFTVSGVVAAGTTGVLTSTASVAAPAGVTDPVPGNNTAVDTNPTGVLTADLGVAVTPAAASVQPGALSAYTIQVSNGGVTSSIGAVVTISIPGGAGFVSAAGAGWTCSLTGSTVTCSLAVPVVVGVPASPIALSLLAPVAPGAFALPAAVTSATADPNPANDDDSATVTVASASSSGGAAPTAPTADLSITKAVDRALVATGDQVAYTLEVANAGPDSAADVVVTDTLPEALAPISVGGPGWTCELSANVARCRSASIAVGTAAPITVLARAVRGGLDVTNAASVIATTDDPVAANNTASVTSRVQARADLAVVKSASSATYLPGQAITFTVTVRNTGPDPVVGARVQDFVPAAISGFRWSCSAVGGACARFSGRGAVDALLDLAAGGRATFSSTGVIPAGTSGAVVNRAQIEAPAGTVDPNRANNRAAVTVQRGVGPTRISVAVTPRLSVIREGGSPAPIRVATTNRGGEAARAVVTCLRIPAGVTIARHSGGRLSAGRYCWRAPVLHAGKTVTYALAVRGDARVARKVRLIADARARNAAGVLAENAVLLLRPAAKLVGGFTG